MDKKKKYEQQKDTTWGIDFEKPDTKARCCKCEKFFTNYCVVAGIAAHYCAEHWPMSKHDWRHDALREAWLKNKEKMVKLYPDYMEMTPYEQYELTVKHS